MLQKGRSLEMRKGKGKNKYNKVSLGNAVTIITYLLHVCLNNPFI